MNDGGRRPEAVVHVGLHKTGTTAFQAALDEAGEALADRGVHVLRTEGPLGSRIVSTAQAVHLANLVVRDDLDPWFRLLLPELHLPEVRVEGRRSIAAQVGRPEPVLVASMECLSLVRTAAEVERLVALMSPRRVRVVVVLRDPAAYLSSMRRQVLRMGYRITTPYPHSCLHLDDGSWLADYDALVAAYVDVLGSAAVTVLDYDGATAAEGSVVPTLWRACDLPDDLLPAATANWANVTEELSPPPRDDGVDLTDDLDVLRAIARQARRDQDAAERRLALAEAARAPLSRAVLTRLRESAARLRGLRT